MNSKDLFKSFVDSLEFELDDVPRIDGVEDYRIIESTLSSSALDEIHRILPLKFSKLYEELLLTYHWPDAEIGDYLFYANNATEGWQGLVRRITRDEFIYTKCVEAKYLPIGQGASFNYDQLCFNWNLLSNGEPSLALIDHEGILCNDEVVVAKHVANSFEEFIKKHCCKALG